MKNDFLCKENQKSPNQDCFSSQDTHMISFANYITNPLVLFGV
jgi:hypothetical protein